MSTIKEGNGRYRANGVDKGLGYILLGNKALTPHLELDGKSISDQSVLTILRQALHET